MIVRLPRDRREVGKERLEDCIHLGTGCMVERKTGPQKMLQAFKHGCGLEPQSPSSEVGKGPYA